VARAYPWQRRCRRLQALLKINTRASAVVERRQEIIPGIGATAEEAPGVTTVSARLCRHRRYLGVYLYEIREARADRADAGHDSNLKAQDRSARSHPIRG
jgi:hypothetical protein